MKLLRRMILVLGLVCAAALFSGCASTDDQVSTRPWNSPRGWEHGLPSQMLEGR